MNGKTVLGLSVGAMVAALVVVALVGNVGMIRRVVFPAAPRIGG
jgi:hypothetical protein